MADIELPKESREALARRLATYLQREHGVELGGFDAQFLLDHILETVGPHIYNQALVDAAAVTGRKLEEVADALYQLERPAKL